MAITSCVSSFFFRSGAGTFIDWEFGVRGGAKQIHLRPGQQLSINNNGAAVPADSKTGEVADQISALLSESGCCDEKSLVLDWKYATNYGDNFEKAPVVTAPRDVSEGEIFDCLKALVFNKRFRNLS
jgi:hypothetical protein